MKPTTKALLAATCTLALATTLSGWLNVALLIGDVPDRRELYLTATDLDTCERVVLGSPPTFCRNSSMKSLTPPPSGP